MSTQTSVPACSRHRDFTVIKCNCTLSYV